MFRFSEDFLPASYLDSMAVEEIVQQFLFQMSRVLLKWDA